MMKMLSSSEIKPTSRKMIVLRDKMYFLFIIKYQDQH